MVILKEIINMLIDGASIDDIHQCLNEVCPSQTNINHLSYIYSLMCKYSRMYQLNNYIRNWTEFVDINYADPIKGNTALINACSCSNTTSNEETVLHLIESGAKLDVINKVNITALIIASSNSGTMSTEHTVKMLIDAGADVNVQGVNNWSALMISCHSKSSTTHTVEMLIDSGTNLNIQSKLGYTALMYACNNANQYIVKILLSSDADVWIQNNKGKLASEMASHKPISDMFTNYLVVCI